MINLILYGKKLIKVNRYHKKIILNAKQTDLSSLFEDPANKDIGVYISEAVSSPMVLGFHKDIFLPDVEFNEEELQNILQHELQHIKNHDILIKQIINLLGIVYWWFPPMKKLTKNIDLFLEMRVDSKVVEHQEIKKRFAYAHTLLNVQKKLTVHSHPDLENAAAFLISDHTCALEYRINYLLKGNITKKTKYTILCILIFLPFLSNMIILEPFYAHSKDVEGHYTSDYIVENGTVVQHQDNTYSLVLDGKSGSIVDPSEFIKLGITVKKE